MRVRWGVAALSMGFALACGGGETGTAPSASGLDPAVAAVAPPAPSEVPSVDSLDPAVVDAYAADCRHVFPAKLTEEEQEFAEGNTADECTWRFFEQNCSPDLFGCWDKAEKCRDGCGSPCASCQSTCADTCDSCKSSCGGDAACARKCAESRAQCRATCLNGKETCENTGCTEVESTCAREAEAKKAQVCGDCATQRACIEAAWAADDYEAKGCASKHPEVPQECWTWCSPGF